jgi:lysozyme
MAGEPELAIGSEGEWVVRLQELLSGHGFDPGGHDGIFGPGTDAAVRAFQQSRGLRDDGVVGPKTWQALTGGEPQDGHHLTDEGAEFIGRFEGFSATLYNDPVGHCTIGFGHLVHHGPCEGSEPDEFQAGITVQRAVELLHADAGSAGAVVNSDVLVPLNQEQFDALVSFTFNVGTGNFLQSTLLRLLNEGQYDAVPVQLNRWIFADDQVFEGLVRRREAEGLLFRDGIYEGIRERGGPPPPPTRRVYPTVPPDGP